MMGVSQDDAVAVHESTPFTPTDRLEAALSELRRGFPAVVASDQRWFLLTPEIAVGATTDARFGDLPLVDARPFTRAQLGSEWPASEGNFRLVVDGDTIGVVTRAAALAAALAGQRRVAETGAHEKLMRVLRHVPDGVVLLDASRAADLANRAGHAMLEELGCAAGPITSLAGMAMDDLIEAAERGVPHDLSVERSGRRRVFSVRALRPFDEDAETLLLLRDVTELRRREIEQATRERFAVVGQLANGIAHDFDNVLAVILLNTSAYLSSRTGDVVEIIQTIDEAARSASRLARELLAFGRRERSGPVGHDLGITLFAIEHLFQRVLVRARLEVRVASDLRRLAVDPLQVERMVANLVLNARDAMPEGGLIVLEARNHDSSGVVITVDDEGVGIPKDRLPYIFDAHFTTKHGGLGLGLSTVHSIVQELGGSISVESREGGGTRFSIWIPAPSEPLRPG